MAQGRQNKGDPGATVTQTYTVNALNMVNPKMDGSGVWAPFNGLPDTEFGFVSGLWNAYAKKISPSSELDAKIEVWNRPGLNGFIGLGSNGGTNAIVLDAFYWESPQAGGWGLDVYFVLLNTATTTILVSWNGTAGATILHTFAEKVEEGQILPYKYGSVDKLIVLTEYDGIVISYSAGPPVAWTVTQITDTDFPPKQTPPLNLRLPAAVMDGYLFVGVKTTTSGQAGGDRIYNCDLGDPTSWNSAGYVVCEQESNSIVSLYKSRQYIIALTTNGIEYFRNTANAAPNSPLSRDVSYYFKMQVQQSVGLFRTTAIRGDAIYFMGRPFGGSQFGLWKLEAFELKELTKGCTWLYDWLQYFRATSAVFGGTSGYGQLIPFTWNGMDFIMIKLAEEAAAGDLDYYDSVTVNGTWPVLVYNETEDHWAMWGYDHGLGGESNYLNGGWPCVKPANWSLEANFSAVTGGVFGDVFWIPRFIEYTPGTPPEASLDGISPYLMSRSLWSDYSGGVEGFPMCVAIKAGPISFGNSQYKTIDKVDVDINSGASALITDTGV